MSFLHQTLLAAVLLMASSTQPTRAAFFSTNPPAIAPPSIPADVTFLPPDTTEILEDACRETAQLMKRAMVPVSKSVSRDGAVGISYVHWPSTTTTTTTTTKGKSQQLPPVVMVHGFDSSCLEYRRLGSKLAAQGIDAYAVDILGWGFTQLEGVDDFSAKAKVEALNSFVDTVVGSSTKFCVAGASLGGAAAIELASSNQNCQGMILIDAQVRRDTVPKPYYPCILACFAHRVKTHQLIQSHLKPRSGLCRWCRTHGGTAQILGASWCGCLEKCSPAKFGQPNVVF